MKWFSNQFLNKAPRVCQHLLLIIWRQVWGALVSAIFMYSHHVTSADTRDGFTFTSCFCPMLFSGSCSPLPLLLFAASWRSAALTRTAGSNKVTLTWSTLLSGVVVLFRCGYCDKRLFVCLSVWDIWRRCCSSRIFQYVWFPALCSLTTQEQEQEVSVSMCWLWYCGKPRTWSLTSCQRR